MSNVRKVSLAVVITMLGLAPSADACHGLLRRLFGPRTVCVPAPAYEVEPRTAVVPKLEIEKKATVVPNAEPDTLEGRVTFVGELPKPKDMTEMIKRGPDKLDVAKASKEELLDPTWRIDPKTRGVANVVVFIRRPATGVLPIRSEDRTRKTPVVIDVPSVNFVPHVAAHYPEWIDGKEQGATGEELIFKNSVKVGINICAIGDGKVNDGFNRNLSPGTSFNCAKDLRPGQRLKAQRFPVRIGNEAHTWMSAYVFIFDHPYFAITKSDGTFSIPRVPVGTQLQLVVWHESQGWLFTKDGLPVTLKKGKNSFEFGISAK